LPHALSQIPQGFNYQAIARDGSGNILPNTPLQAMMYVQSLSTGGTIFWKELHSTVTTNSFGLFTLVVGTGTRQTESTVATFDLIDWSVTPKYLKTEIYYSGSWKDMGTSQLMSVPYTMVAGDLAGTVDKLAVKGTTSGLEDALFEVKNKDGQTVFAVYNEGVRIYVSDGAKAIKGGFAVGGFGTDKAESTKYLFVGKDSVRIYLDTNPLTKGKKSGFAVGGYDLSKGTVQNYLDISADSVRIYIDSNPDVKKLKGGFAVGGYDLTKGMVQDYLDISPDSVRIYIDDTNGSGKGRKGGFAVGGFDLTKGGNASFLNVEIDTIGIINPSKNRIQWYPLKNAFLTGKVLVESKDSVGINSFASGYESKAVGDWSQALGYKAISRGYYSTAIGKYAYARKRNSFAFGDSARAISIESYAFGRGATALGYRSFAFGSAGLDSTGQTINSAFSVAKGDYSFAIGQGSEAQGKGAFAIGIMDKANGDFSSVIGYNTIAPSAMETVIGCFNTEYSPTSNTVWNTSDRLFVIGKGTGDFTRSNAMTILKNGCVGLQSVTNPTYAFQLPNSSIIGVGSGRAYAWTTYSDSRLKENQVPLVYGLAEVMELNPKQYIHHSSIDQASWSNDVAQKSIGLVAQDVYTIIPEAVDAPMNDSTELWGINYNKIVPVLVNAIQEQQHQIESYKSENDNLKSQLQSLLEKVDKIEVLLAKALDE
jgi:hypothetical protein